MVKGKRLEEKYTGMKCTVVSVHCSHILVKFDHTDLQTMVHQRNYKHYREADDNKQRELRESPL